mmetsp:Transcript_68651/g.147057  ORF Transcript_68651/g.147057 Transcript_68651/m.147057 type:complete len:265 (+) Transcript_68651:2055-2849(+)
MLGEGFAVAPALRVWFVVRVVIPALERDPDGHVRADDHATEPARGVPGGREPSGKTADGHGVPVLQKEKVHGALKLSGDVGVPHRALLLLSPKLRHPVHGPLVHLLRHRAHEKATCGVVLLVSLPLDEEGAHCGRLAERDILVRQDVGAQQDHSARRHWNFVGVNILVLMDLQLQVANDRTDEDDRHDLVPQELLQPCRHVMLGEVRALCGYSCLVHHRASSMGEVKADAIKEWSQLLGRVCHQAVQPPQARTILAIIALFGAN